MAVTNIQKIKPAEPYRVDNRVTVMVGLKPFSLDINDGPKQNPGSGYRVNPDASGF